MFDRFKSLFSFAFSSKQNSNAQQESHFSYKTPTKNKKEACFETVPSIENVPSSLTTGTSNCLPKIKQLKAINN